MQQKLHYFHTKALLLSIEMWRYFCCVCRNAISVNPTFFTTSFLKLSSLFYLYTSAPCMQKECLCAASYMHSQTLIKLRYLQMYSTAQQLLNLSRVMCNRSIVMLYCSSLITACVAQSSVQIRFEIL